MFNFRTVLTCCLLAFILGGCKSRDSVIPEEGRWNQPYTFFVAGHVYGNPDQAIDTLGLYPPLLDKWPSMNYDPKMKFGVFTGDIVKHNTVERWDSVEAQLSKLDIPVKMVPGNHDIRRGVPYDEFDRRFGPRYYSFRYRHDIFIFWDTNEDHWRITGPQMDMLVNELKSLRKVDNVFLFMHNILWWENDRNSPHYFPSFPNSQYNRHDTLNFWTEIVPQLESLDQDVYMFAGDIGAWCFSPGISYYRQNNMHMIASGMGCHAKSHFIRVHIDEDKNVTLELVALGDRPENDMGTLEDYRYE